ncbi:type IV secretory system conjugative DNA transfer family protein [Haladaptatus sp. DYF46]|uniref:type IV secretory system conjugative DNA transfer family protein n=1 Tax=Haladaptatus sp. DYF46 TaxID=2886041 RepID=UPI001E5AF5DC|nr:type IV secretory system conjugative DNA transfer family protein [Haladaptatus sp. DYF46]
MSLFNFNSDDEPAADEPATDEVNDVPDELQSLTGEPYQIDPQDHIREGGTYVATKTPSTSPDREYDLVASERIRRGIEDGYENSQSPIWAGYNVSAQQGYTATGFPFRDMFQHLWVVGTTGAGKTTLLLNQMVQLAYAGHGFVYFDPKAEDSRELLRMLPEHRLDDVVWIEPGSDEFEKTVAINFLDVPECDTDAERERAIEDRLEVLKAIFDNDEYWGINMESITESMGRAMLRHNVEADHPQDYYSIIDFYFVLLNQQRREQFAQEVEDPFVAEFVNEIAEMEDDEVRPLLKRIKSWVENGIIRRIAACRSSTIDFEEIINDNKIVIVRTPVTNDDIKQMISLGTMRPIWTAVQNKSFDGKEREPFFAIFDESDKVLNENLDVEDMLARARSMKLSVTLACQYPTQLKKAGVLKAVENNCNNLMAFRVNDDDDARPLMKKFRGYEVEDLIETENYRIWTRVPLNSGGYSDPLKLHTFPPYPPLRSEDEVDEVIRTSLDQYGRIPQTDEEIQQNLQFGSLGEALETTVEEQQDSEQAPDELTDKDVLEALFVAAVERIGDGMGSVSVREIEAECKRRTNYDNYPAFTNLVVEKLGGLVETQRADGKVMASLTEQGHTKLFEQDTGKGGSGGGEDHRWVLGESFKAFTRLGCRVSLPSQDEGGELPDGVADLPIDPTAEPTLPKIEEKREELINRYGDLYEFSNGQHISIEAETTTIQRPMQTLTNLRKAIDDNRKCVFTTKDATASKGTFEYWARRGERIIYKTTGRGRGVETDYSALTCASEGTDGNRVFFNMGEAVQPEANRYALRPAVDGLNKDSDTVQWREEGNEIVLVHTQTNEEYARFIGTDGVQAADKAQFPAYYHYDPGERTYTIYHNGTERTYGSQEEWADEWKKVPRPYLPEVEFSRMPIEDDFEFVIFPDDDNDTYDEPQRYERGEIRPLFGDEQTGEKTSDNEGGDDQQPEQEAGPAAERTDPASEPDDEPSDESNDTEPAEQPADTDDEITEELAATEPTGSEAEVSTESPTESSDAEPTMNESQSDEDEDGSDRFNILT